MQVLAASRRASPQPLPSVRIAFAGTPEFAVPALRALLEHGAEVSCVLTQPDRPAGRGRRATASPVKRVAAGLHLVQPPHLRDPGLVSELGPAPDLLVVVAYGLIIPEWLLVWPRLGAVNVHASLLPRWRGAAPIQRAILAGDACTGISIMQMDAGLDTGPVYTHCSVDIEAATSAPELHDRLADLGARALLAVLPGILDATAQPVPQDASQATYAHKIDKSEAQIDWSADADAIDRQVRAFAGWPVAESTLTDGRRLRIWGVVPEDTDHDATPGTVLAADGRGISVAAGRGIVRITQLQPPGGRVMDAASWLAAHSIDHASFRAPRQ